jgi:hypothetical protein
MAVDSNESGGYRPARSLAAMTASVIIEHHDGIQHHRIVQIKRQGLCLSRQERRGQKIPATAIGNM